MFVLYCCIRTAVSLRRREGFKSNKLVQRKKKPGSVHVRFVVDKVALGHVFPPEYFGFSPVNFIPPLLHYKDERKNHLHHKLHNKPQGCGASVASAAGPFNTKNRMYV